MNLWGAAIYGVIVILSYVYAFKKNKKGGKQAVRKSGVQFFKQLPMLISIFLLIGLFDRFVPKSVVMTFVGKGNEFLSILSSAIFGTIVMGPVSSAYPMGALLLRKGATITATAIFLNSWVMVGFVTIPYEISIFGRHFTLIRNALAFMGAIIIGILTGWILGGIAL